MEKVKDQEIYIRDEEEIDLFELLGAILKYKKLIVAVTLLPTLMITAISLIMEDIYRSEATIISVAPSQRIPFGQLSDILPVGIDLSEDNKKILAILQSRHIRERIVERLNLHTILLENTPEDKDPKELAINMLEGMTNISEDRKLGTIKISVDHKDPQISFMIVNAYLEEVQKIIDEKALTKAKIERLSIERKLKEEEENLKRLQEELVSFQKKTKLVAPKEQLTSSMELYSKLISQKTELEMELKSLLTAGADLDRITEVRNKIREIKKKIEELESKEKIGAIPSFRNIPEEMSTYYSILREMKISQTIYETLLKLYENVRFAEMKEAIYIEVIDPPYTLQDPVKPNRKLMVAVAFVSSLFLGIFIALIIESVKKRKQRLSFPSTPDGSG